jgi:hypothetical protein
MLAGRCHCGKIRFEMPDQAAYSTICHCRDCRGQSGAPILAWGMVPKSALSVQGEPKVYKSSEGGRRSFCPDCGTGLFFTNPQLHELGMIQIRLAALEDPNAIRPNAQVQTAERITWIASLHQLPAFERFPG